MLCWNYLEEVLISTILKACSFRFLWLKCLPDCKIFHMLCRPRYHPWKSRKRRLGWVMKSPPKVKLRGLWYRPCKILISLLRIHLNWFNRINFKLILLTLLFKSFFLKTNLNWSYVLLLDIFSIITQWASVNKFYLFHTHKISDLT